MHKSIIRSITVPILQKGVTRATILAPRSVHFIDPMDTPIVLMIGWTKRILCVDPTTNTSQVVNLHLDRAKLSKACYDGLTRTTATAFKEFTDGNLRAHATG